MSFNNFPIVKVMENTLNYVDERLIDHGRRVAYLVYRALRRQGACTGIALDEAVLLSLLHDIGAYQTEEIDKMLQFEMEKVWEHSTYGYLFLKHFSPLSHLAPVILFHHADCADLANLASPFRELAQTIHVADRFDILAQMGKDTSSLQRHFEQGRNVHFLPEVLDLFFFDGWERLFEEMDGDREFSSILYGGTFSERNLEAYVRMLALSIDFRSPQTVAHTFTSTCVCRILAGCIGVDDNEAVRLFWGAMLHDLGKVGIPAPILEKSGRLTEAEMEIMKKHVGITENILLGKVDELTLRLAVRHHEKLDGSGYPRGLNAGSLTKGQRLVAVADIFSALCGTRTYKAPYPRDKVESILRDMVLGGLLDADIVAAALGNYDLLMEEIEKTTRPVVNTYGQMKMEYDTLLEQIRDPSRGPASLEIL